MDFKHIAVTEVLDIENVELYQTYGHSGDLITQGTLNLLYSKQHDWYILRVNHFNYGISKRIPVLASSHEKGAVRAYVVPNPHGYFIIKITRAYSLEQIDKLESILKSTTEFAYKDSQGLPVKFDDQSVTVKRGAAPEDEIEEQRQTTAAHLIFRGGKATRRMIVGAAQSISNGISRLGGHIQTDNVTTKDENPIEPKKASRLALFNSATGMVTSTTFYMKGLTSLGNWIGQAIETKLEERHAEKEIKKIKARTAAISAQTSVSTYLHPEGVIGVGYATIYSGIMIWQGMLEALDIIREGLSETAGGIVTRRYGPVAGEVFRAGVSVAAGVSLPGEGLFKRRI